MARQGSKIEPNLELKRYGLGDGWIVVTGKGVSITLAVDPGSDYNRSIPLENGHENDLFSTIMLDPESAPLFRMVANRLDELAGKRVRR